MMRFCPRCETERALSEIYCEGVVEDQPCDWDLSQLPVRPSGWRPRIAEPTPPAAPLTCPNGHPVEAGDFLCSDCGAEIEVAGIQHAETPEVAGIPSADDQGATVISGWVLADRLPTTSQVKERFRAISSATGQEAMLTLYTVGHEPEVDVYAALAALPIDHVPQIFTTGRWEGRVFEVSERLPDETMEDVDIRPDDLEGLTTLVGEVAGALNALAECGIRHRDIQPNAIVVREREPLDLVLTNFGSATLSQSDLDIIAPLEITRYTAPEAIAGGVAPSSDWWSLGMVLLEKVTRGACFAGVNDQAFLIHIMTNGAPIPAALNPRVELLLRGLLARDRHARWGWTQVREWLDGESPLAPEAAQDVADAESKRGITLGGRRYAAAKTFALAAAQGATWDEALDLFRTGALATWAEEAGLTPVQQAEMSQISRLEDTSDDLKLALTLKVLNPALPLSARGEIVTPGWLLDHPAEGYDLIAGPAPQWLADKDAELWLARLRRRADTVRQRAKHLEIELNEDELRIHLLSTSPSRLAAVWAERRQLLPDTDHAGLAAILERRQTTDEDYILLLGAHVGQFRTTEVIVSEALEAAKRAGVETFDVEAAANWLQRPRRELNLEIERRTEGFARCGLDLVDEWADQFRLERRLAIARALALLAVPEEAWKAPANQSYIATLLEFFAKRITGAVLRGPLTRLVIGKTTARVDLNELGTPRRTAAEILDHLLLRNDQVIEVDPAAFAGADTLERRLRTLHSQATLYRRDTGIDGLYLGFPFLLMKEPKASVRPRIAPVLLWPVKIQPEVGARGRVTIAFDRDREEVRLNPAFEPLLGPDTSRRWKDIAHELLSRSSLTAADVMDAFHSQASLDGRVLAPLPSKDVAVEVGKDRLACAAAFFHLAYVGQAVMEDLHNLKSRGISGTALETALRVAPPSERKPVLRGDETDRYLTAVSDPSQENAVLEARERPGLLVEGPPGTGKSQTIVNMVADAIGRNQSLLVVCQKQAALDVVLKRLEAEGLSNRIVMIKDVNKDRRAIISAVRDQLEALRTRPVGLNLGWMQRRQQVAARIEALEAEIDRHHQALHAPDESSGLSYRLILADLIGNSPNGEAPVSVPSLRKILEPMTVMDVAMIEEACGPLARFWLPSRFEGSALVALATFSPDAGTLKAFEADFDAFNAAEAARRATMEATPLAKRIDDPDSYRAWAQAHRLTFDDLSEADWRLLARWRPLFEAPDLEKGDRCIAEVKELQIGLSNLGVSTDPKAEAAAEALTDSELREMSSALHALLKPAAFIDVVSLKRWGLSRRVRRWTTEQGLTNSLAELARIVDRETAFRPWRARSAQTQSALEDPMPVTGVTPTALVAELHRLQHQLERIRDLFVRLDGHPDPQGARDASTAGSAAPFEAFMDAVDQGYQRHEARGFSQAAAKALEPWFTPEWLAERQAAIDSDTDNEHAVAAIAQAIGTTAAYQRFRPRAGQLTAQHLQIFAELRTVGQELGTIPETALEGEVRRILKQESRLAWKARVEAAHPVLLLESAELEAKAEALAQADVEMRSLNGRLLTDGLDESRIRPAREWEDITRLQGQRARRLREFMDRGSELGLMSLRPVWLMNPDIASRVLPLRAGMFDSVIYDEASQMPVEYALPTLYRSKAVIVSGDEKQMPPTAFFSSRVENDEAEIFDGEELDEDASEEERDAVAETWNRREIKDCPDLLQLAKSVLPNTTLQIHYRSVYRELIQFSNSAFYLNNLSVPARHPEDEIRRVRPIELIRADGVYHDQTNRTEAERVVELLGELWAKPRQDRPTIGVVTFNRKQADLIEEVLERRAERDAQFREALGEERDRYEAGEDMSFFVKNVENVQGDERDVIVFSSTFGRNAQGAFRRAFGVLGQKGGERRLNVAVTRARRKVYLVTSMPIGLISDLLTTRRPASSPRDHLQAYFEYARAVSDGELDVAQGLLARVASERRPEHRRQLETSHDGFQASVAAFIREQGWEPVETSDIGAFGLDFAVVDPRTGLFGIGIECDAPQHGLLTHARAREMWRPSILRRSIPAVHRVSSQAWHHEPEMERRRLRDAMAHALGRMAA